MALTFVKVPENDDSVRSATHLDESEATVVDVLDEPSLMGCPCCIPCEPRVDRSSQSKPGGICNSERLRVVGIILLYVLLISTCVTLVALGYLEDFAVYVQTLGLVGNISFVALLCVAQQPFGWGWSFLLVAVGFTYGWIGALTILVAQQLGSITAYLLATYVAKDLIRRMIDNAPHKGIPLVFHGFESKLKEKRNAGVFYLAALRLTPMPSGISTSLIAFSKVGFPTFWISSLLGMWVDIPIYMNTGILIKKLGGLNNSTGEIDFDFATGDPTEVAAFALQISVTVFLLSVSAWYGRKLVRDLHVEEDAEEIP